MEQTPDYPEIIDNTKFASELYSAVDWLFDRRGVRPRFTLTDDRHSELELGQNELDFIGPVLETYALDAPYSAKIELSGHNPYIYKNALGGAVKITMVHGGDPGESDTVTSEYRVVLTQPNPDTEPVKVSKQVMSRHGKHAAAEAIDEVIHASKPLVYDEQRALRALINML
jgi:hypothetical protein